MLRPAAAKAESFYKSPANCAIVVPEATVRLYVELPPSMVSVPPTVVVAAPTENVRAAPAAGVLLATLLATPVA